MDPTPNLTCRLCGNVHRSVRLEPGERALCARCGTVLARASRLGPDAALVFSVTGLVLAVPASLLTFVRAGKLGAERLCTLFTGAGILWDGGMRSLALLVVLCGALVPFALLATLAAVHAPARFGWPGADLRPLFRVAQGLGHWAIPEVQVLAVLVALMKLGSVVDVTVGPGFWCYCAMALSLLIAQRIFESDPSAAQTRAGEPAAAAPP
jgi:paraquat-inducible protein A